jgi:hypothetical protein
MNTLDELISSSSAVPGPTTGALSRGRADLDVAFAAQVRPDTPVGRAAPARRLGGLRGKVIIGVAGVAAVAAAVTVVALPSTPSHTAGKSLAARPKPARRTSTSSVTFSVTAAKATLTAAVVFAEAAKGAQAAGLAPDGNAPLVNGWPAARYWHTVDQSTDFDCPGLVTTGQSWLAKSGALVADNTDNRPSSGTCGLAETLGVYPVYNNPAGPMIGGQTYTWAQFAALPTDPAQLLPILQADSTAGVSPYKGEPEQDFLFQTISILLAGDPVSPAMRMALFELAEKIPGAIVAGEYTDSLGRTGIALRLGADTQVIDTSNGQILATLSADEPLSPGCVRPSWTGNPDATCVEGDGGATVYISAGPANTEPQVDLVPGDALHSGKPTGRG